MRLLTAIAASVSTATAPPPPNATAHAPAGTFVGYLENGTAIWRGIPYAEPPVGDLRWRKTVKKAKIQGQLEAKTFGAACAQIGPGWASLGGLIKNCHDFLHGCPNMTWSNATSEDCLSLNVYSPADYGAHSQPHGLPVVVYFPAGAFQWGASNDEENNGYHKSITPGWNNTVFVSANYRTGIFGFLASDSLRKRSGDNSSGLLGVHDQTTVLQWVQENIAAFGGDPKRVMIFGESAGATSMTLHLVMPESAGLYHAVAIDSGAFNQWAYRSWDDAIDIWDNITKALGCDAWAEPLDCMLTKPTAVLLNCSDAYYGNETGRSLPHPEAINGTQWGPVVDGVLLPQSPMAMLAQGHLAGGGGQGPGDQKVPLLLGSNGDEGTTFLSDNVPSAGGFLQWCQKTFGETIGEAVAAYYSDYSHWDWPVPTPESPEFCGENTCWDAAAQAVIGDFVMWCPLRSAVEALASQGHDVYLYDFVHAPAVSVNWPSGTHGLGAFHGAEVPYVFGDTFELEGGELNLSRAMSRFWTNMASSGNPNQWVGPTATPPVVHAGFSGGAATSSRRGLQVPPQKPRPASYRYFWESQDETCDVGQPLGAKCGSDHSSGTVQSCQDACMSDSTCWGFVVSKDPKDGKLSGHLHSASCEHSRHSKPDSYLFLLHSEPERPHISLPKNCSMYSQSAQCFNRSESYKTIAINITAALRPGGSKYSGHSAPDLNKCCAACTQDTNCHSWYVPNDSNGTECLLIGKDSYHAPVKGSSCLGALAPAWLPPPQCHNLFVPLQPGMRVNFSSSEEPSRHHWGRLSIPNRTVLEGENLASCCEKCYNDYQASSGPCAHWTMPDPTNGTCVHYGAANTKLYFDRDPLARNSSFIGASRLPSKRPPPPPPPGPCLTAQHNDMAWPKWSKDADRSVRFDLCNISVVPDIKKGRCDFWHATVDQYWAPEKWIPANPHNKLRGKVLDAFKLYQAVRQSARHRPLV
jgi:carboxylesterase type B